MASSTSPITAPSSTSAPITTLRSSQSPRSRRGGSEWGVNATLTRANSSSRPTSAGATALQRLADELGIAIHVSHFPPGTSKWNKIEHRLFSFITMNWRGRPLRTYETVVNLIGNTTNSAGLVVHATLDRRRYPIGKKVTAKQMSDLAIERHHFQGTWNYALIPRPNAE